MCLFNSVSVGHLVNTEKYRFLISVVEAAVSRLAYQESNLILIVLGNYLLNYGFLGLICMHITYIVN